MTNAICGHKRDVLTMALEDLAHIDNDIIVGLARLPAALPEWRGAVLDLVDPAKLAAIMAAVLREDGASAWVDGAPRTTPPRRDQFAFFPYQDAIQVYPPTTEEVERSKLFTLPEARALLLQWLNKPNGAHEEAERVLRGNHADPDELLNTIPAREYPEPRRLDPSPET